MAVWDKVKFFWDTMLGSPGSTLTATSTATGNYDVDYLYNMLETTTWKAANTTVPIYITFDRGEVTLSNGDFETGDVSNWTAYFNSGAGASGSFAVNAATPYEGTYKGLVTITGAGAVASDIQISQKGLSTESGKAYTVVFAVQAASARTMVVVVTRNQPPYSALGLNETISLTTAWQLFRFVFVATQDCVDARINFQVGGDSNNVALDVVDIFPADDSAADFIGILGHNLNTIGAEVTLQNSSNNFTNLREIWASRPLADTILFGELRLVANPGFEAWGSGPSAAPSGWSVLGAGASVARSSNEYQDGKYSPQLTYGSAIASIRQPIQDFNYFKGKTLTLGMWVLCSTASIARIGINDVVGETDSAYHTGVGEWEWLTVTRTIDSAATNLEILMRVDAAGLAYCDGAVLIEGSSVAPTDKSDLIPSGRNNSRWSRLKITAEGASLSAAPEMAICIWGNKTELGRARVDFDPHGQTHKANINIGPTGYVLGIHNKHVQRDMTLAFPNADSALYDKVAAWRDGSGLKNFFVAWERSNHPEDVFLMRPDPKFFNPFRHGGTRRAVSIKLLGRAE